MIESSKTILFRSRLPALILSLLSLVGNCYAISILMIWLESIELDSGNADYDQTEGSALVIFLGTALRSWSGLSACVAAAGSVGATMDNLALTRVFAFGSTLDLFLDILVYIIVLLLTFSPTLAAPFSDLLCNTLTKGELFSTTSMMLREQEASRWTFRGVNAIVYGIDNCEDNWRSGVCVVLAVFSLGIILRMWGVSCIWEYYSVLERDSRGEAGDWFDLREVEKETVKSRMGHGGRFSRPTSAPMRTTKSSSKRSRLTIRADINFRTQPDASTSLLPSALSPAQRTPQHSSLSSATSPPPLLQFHRSLRYAGPTSPPPLPPLPEYSNAQSRSTLITISMPSSKPAGLPSRRMSRSETEEDYASETSASSRSYTAEVPPTVRARSRSINTPNGSELIRGGV